ncbi:hypothetical protein RA263_27975, partial [Pseudomonas syringae pv. tagetis]
RGMDIKVVTQTHTTHENQTKTQATPNTKNTPNKLTHQNQHKPHHNKNHQTPRHNKSTYALIYKLKDTQK